MLPPGRWVLGMHVLGVPLAMVWAFGCAWVLVGGPLWHRQLSRSGVSGIGSRGHGSGVHICDINCVFRVLRGCSGQPGQAVSWTSGQCSWVGQRWIFLLFKIHQC